MWDISKKLRPPSLEIPKITLKLGHFLAKCNPLPPISYTVKRFAEFSYRHLPSTILFLDNKPTGTTRSKPWSEHRKVDARQNPNTHHSMILTVMKTLISWKILSHLVSWKILNHFLPTTASYFYLHLPQPVFIFFPKPALSNSWKPLLGSLTPHQTVNVHLPGHHHSHLHTTSLLT